MARAPDERVEKAHELFKKGLKLIEIASQLDVPEGTVRSWKNRYKWNATLQSSKRNVAKRNKGGQPGNRNSVGNDGGGPPGNKKAEKYGFFAKYLPEETKEIFDAISQANPLDLLWHQIQIAYAAIIRAQQIAYVKDRDDVTTTKIGEGYSDSGSSEKWEVQQAWDKQSNFMKAQARAQGELRSMIKQYDEMLHKDWELATEEQKARIMLLKAKVEDPDDEEVSDDGFLDALNASAKEDWSDEEA
nr:MAG TPA: Small Terminase [Caudoviricetes sp.]